MAKRIWRERDHPRANDGKFARKGGSNWLARVSKQFEASFGDTSAGERTFQGERTDPRLGGRLQTGGGSLLDISGMSAQAKARFPKPAPPPGGAANPRREMGRAIQAAADAYRPKTRPGPGASAEVRYKDRLAGKLDNLAERVQSGDTSPEEARAELGRLGRDMASMPSKNLSTSALVSAQKALRDGERTDLGLDRPAPPGAKLPVTTRRPVAQRVDLRSLNKRTDQELQDMIDQRRGQDSLSAQSDIAQIEQEQTRRQVAASRAVESTDSFLERMSAKAGARVAPPRDAPQWGTFKSAGVKPGDLVMYHGGDRSGPNAEGRLARVEGTGFYRLVDPEIGDRITTWGGSASKGWIAKAPDTGLDTGRATGLNGGMATTVPTRTATQRVPLKNLDRRTDQELADMIDQRGEDTPNNRADVAQIEAEQIRRRTAPPDQADSGRRLALAGRTESESTGDFLSRQTATPDRPFRGGTITDETPPALRPLRDQVWEANTKRDAATVLRNADPELVGQLADHLGVARTRAAVVDAVRNGVTAEAKAQKSQDLTPAMQSTLDRIRKNGGLSYRLNSNSRRFATVSPQERVVLQALERRGLVRNTGSGIDFKYELVDQATPPAADVAAHVRPKPSTGVVLPGKKVTIKGTPEGIQIRDAGTTDYKGDKMYTLFDADGNEIGTLQKVTRTSAVKAPGSRIASGFRQSAEWEATVKGGTTSRERGTGYTAAQALERMPSKAEVDAARERRREQNARSAGAEISANDMSGALGKLTQQAIQRDIAQKEYSDLLGHPDPTVQARAQKLLDNWLKGLMTPDEFQREMRVERDRAQGKA